MPSSTWHNIETFVEIIRELRPASFLDIGVGNGKWGFLVREYTDVWDGHFLRSQWNCIIEGIEIYQPYIDENTHQREIYNKIHIGDATKVINKLGLFDIIYAGDVLEHIEKDLSMKLVQQLAAKATMALICSIPLGAEWLGKRGYENDHEDHVSSWQIQELQALGFSYYNVTADPANETRSIGFFVHTCHDLAVSGLKRLGPGWFARTFGGR
jgi:predicted TPR repeat methyltransferase